MVQFALTLSGSHARRTLALDSPMTGSTDRNTVDTFLHRCRSALLDTPVLRTLVDAIFVWQAAGRLLALALFPKVVL